jgi:uncharacterized protein (DUF1697 family)
MDKYIMFLRGINVGGVKVKMEALKNALYILKLKKIETILQSGNVAFESNRSIEEMQPVIEKKLSQVFNYEAFVQIYNQETIDDIIKNYPFEQIEGKHDYIVLINNNEVYEEISANLGDSSDEEIIKTGKNVIYWQVQKGHSLDTKFAKLISKSKYKQSITTRKLETLQKISKL